MMNKLRSEAVIHVDERAVPLKLTLGALAQMEEALGAKTLVELVAKLANPSASQLILIINIMAKAAGGSGDEISLQKGDLNLREAMGVISTLFQALMAGEVPGKPSPTTRDGGPG